MIPNPLNDEVFKRLWDEARTHSHWRKEPVPIDLLHRLYDHAKMAPTSANSSPARFVFLTTDAAKKRLASCLSPGNLDKTMAAPVVVIVAMDLEFYEHLPTLFPHTDARSWFAGQDAAIQSTAMRNSSLQGAYLMLAARALGLDCGPMSGFDADKLNEEFFKNTSWRANFLINLGYGDASMLPPRNPRLSFEAACQVL